LSKQEKHERKISNLKTIIMSKFYIENRKSLIDTSIAHGGPARIALLDLIDKLGDNHELKTYAITRLATV
jgi:hypothetical protein